MRPAWVSFGEVKNAISLRLVLEDYGLWRNCGGAGGNVLDLVAVGAVPGAGKRRCACSGGTWRGERLIPGAACLVDHAGVP